jgi:small subunit ribosomal protein S2
MRIFFYSRWDLKGRHYYAKLHGLVVIDIVKTSRDLKCASYYVQKAACNKKVFLFIGTKKASSTIIKEEAFRCGAHYVNNRWLGGTLTNWSTIKKRVAYLKFLKAREESGEFDLLPKKEASLLRRKHVKLHQNLGGLVHMHQIPHVALIADSKKDSIAVAECRKLKVVTIAMVDTNGDPDCVDIAIPSNADSTVSINLIFSYLTKSIMNGQGNEKEYLN